MSFEWNAERKEATTHTRAYHESLLQKMDDAYLQDEHHDLEELRKHLILEFGKDDILDYDGTVLFDHTKWQQSHAEGFPDSVNPYLWQTIKDN